jgi:predicted transcriptional regulator
MIKIYNTLSNIHKPVVKIVKETNLDKEIVKFNLSALENAKKIKSDTLYGKKLYFVSFNIKERMRLSK